MNHLLMIALIAGANVYIDTFDQANNAYMNNDYSKAITLYEQLVNENVAQPVVFYNLGNAYYRSGRLAPAIANFERALQLDPTFENAQENLQTAVRQTKRQLERPLPPDWEQSLLFWHYGLRQRTTFIVAATLWLVFWSVLAVRKMRRIRSKRWAVMVLGMVAVAFGVSAWLKVHPVMLAVADRDPVPVRYGTNEHDTIRFELYVGDRVTVDKRINGWSRVTTVEGERGWAHDQDLVFVGPPYAPPPAP